MSWYDQAACRNVDPDIFFPGRGESDALAQAICFDCPVRVECLADELTHPIRRSYGIRGGTNQNERQAMKHEARPTRPTLEMARERAAELQVSERTYYRRRKAGMVPA